jgi:hypothetical protein
LPALEPLAGLTGLSLWGCGPLLDEDVAGIVRRHPELTDFLPGGGDALTNGGLEALMDLPLERLSVLSDQVTDEGLAFLPDSLLDLSLSCPGLGDEGVGRIARLTRLTKLSITAAGLTDEAPWLLTGLTALDHLRLHSASWPDMPVAGDRLLEGISHLSSLRSLEVEGNVSAHGLAHLRSLPRLRTLALYNAQELESIAPLAHAPALERLDLVHCDTLRDDDLRPLESMRLKRLGLSRCAKLTDAALRVFAQMRGLEALRLAGRQFTDAGLKHLVHAAALRSLYLGESPALTRAGLAELADAMPRCWVTS